MNYFIILLNKLNNQFIPRYFLDDFQRSFVSIQLKRLYEPVAEHFSQILKTILAR